MRQSRIAVTHPGKMGDALYTLPTIRYLWSLGNTIDFFTSEYCRPIKDFMEFQQPVDRAFVVENYQIQHTRLGVQPWRMPVSTNGYDLVMHLGFRKEPTTRLDWFIAEQAGIDKEKLPPIQYDYPWDTDSYIMPDQPYIIVAPDGRGSGRYRELLEEINEICPVLTVAVGAAWGPEQVAMMVDVDMMGRSFLDTAAWMANSIGFVGMLSSMLVLANGFDIPKVCLLPRKNPKLHHCVQSKNNSYMFMPTAQEVLRSLGL